MGFLTEILRTLTNVKQDYVLKPFHYQLMHTMLKNTESLKHSKITLQHVSVYLRTGHDTRLPGHNMQP